MPNRIIKESIWTSPNLNCLSPKAEKHFYRLLPSADDWGCMDVTPVTVKGRCYPLQSTVTVKEIEQWNQELIDNELLKTWGERGRIYGQFLTFSLHNELDEIHNPKTPCPPWVLTKKGLDPRLPTKRSEAFDRIGAAVEELSKNGDKPTLREIAKEAGSSLTTVTQYMKWMTKQHVTDVTHVTDN